MVGCYCWWRKRKRLIVVVFLVAAVVVIKAVVVATTILLLVVCLFLQLLLPLVVLFIFFFFYFFLLPPSGLPQPHLSLHLSPPLSSSLHLPLVHFNEQDSCFLLLQWARYCSLLRLLLLLAPSSFSCVSASPSTIVIIVVRISRQLRFSSSNSCCRTRY